MAVYLGNNKLTFDGISEIYVGSNKVYGAAPPIDYSTEYFFVENLTSSANTLSIKKNNASAPTITVYRSTDKTSWSSMGSTSTTAITYSIPANSKIYLRATVNNWGSSIYYNSITCSGNHAIGGNIMSLIYGSSFIGKTVFPASSTYNFNHLFFVSNNLKNINNLVLPATTLTDYCYYYMFGSCSGITNVPENLLPATTLADYCYGDMFSSTSITSIPSNLLPATTLADSCYSSMFSSTSITSIPSNFLPATTLTDSCYSSMFGWCMELTTIPSNLLPATTLADSCYSSMFSGCMGLTSIPSNFLPATTLAGGCYSSMFSSCRNITKAPELPATTLASNCYQGMFRSCNSLNEITCYADDISAFWCTKDWLNGVAASGDFYQGGSASWTLDSVDGIPTGWTVKTPIPKYFYVENLTNNANTLSIKKSSASAPTITVYYSVDKTTWVSMGDTDTTAITYTIPAESKVYLKATVNSWSTSSYYNTIACSGNHAVGGNIMSLLYGDNFTGKTVFPTSSSYNFNRLFYNSTNLKNIDNLVLPATTLTQGCYSNMFNGCTGLASVPFDLLPATTLTNYCYSNMFNGCTGLTSIPSNLLQATTLATSCYTGIFNGCTGLTSVPSNLLQATTLATSCYGSMFKSCTGLITIPSTLLPATTLANQCYYQMFYGCTSITTAPELPATTLASGCYRSMFQDCSSLNEITCYANDISATRCTSSWVNGVAATGTFYKKGTASWVIDSVDGVPTGWTVIEEIPYDPINDYFWVENPSTTDTRVISISSNTSQAPPSITVYRSTDKVNWYTAGTTSKYGSFNISVAKGGRTYLKATATAWSGNGSTINITCNQSFAVGGNIMSLIYGDDFIGQTALKSSSNGTFSSLFWRSTNLIDISNLVLPATTLINYCYSSMFEGCTGLTSIPSNLLPATTITNGCYHGMFKGCTMITKAPILPATTLQLGSYFEMFRNCSSLIEITTYANNISATNCTYQWVDGVANNGTFYKLGSASWTTGTNGIPNSTWTVKTSLDS